MSVHERAAGGASTTPRIPRQRSSPPNLAATASTGGLGTDGGVGGAARWLAVLRIVTGLSFCWTATGLIPPGTGFDVALAVGLVVLGVVVTLGIGLRLAAMVGGASLLSIWLIAQLVGPAGLLPGSSVGGAGVAGMDGAFPLVGAAILAVLAATLAGRTWGLAGAWLALPLVRRHRWLA